MLSRGDVLDPMGRTEEMTSYGEDKAELATDAAAWVVRLARDESGETEWLAFAAWLDAAPDADPDQRRTAFDQAQAVWLDLAMLAEAAGDPGTVEQRRPPKRLAPRYGSRAAFASAAAAALVVVLAAGAVWRLTSPSPRVAPVVAVTSIFVTAPGQRRVLRLADGSRVDMDGDTQLQVALASGRRIELQRGEAVFDVVHEPARPFTVQAGPVQVRVLGTDFDVERNADEARVAVARGAVRVSTGRQGLRLNVGETARSTASGLLKIGRVSVADVGSWREDRRVYIDQPLAGVVADLNRRYPRPIRLSSEAAERIRFTGVLVLGPNEADTLRRLTALLPTAARGTNSAVVLSSTSQ